MADPETFALIHVAGQPCNHFDAVISGTREGLQALAETIARALDAGEATVVDAFASDGEGYDLTVKLLSEDEFQKEKPPYIDDEINTAVAYWRERAFESEAKNYRLKKGIAT